MSFPAATCHPVSSVCVAGLLVPGAQVCAVGKAVVWLGEGLTDTSSNILSCSPQPSGQGRVSTPWLPRSYCIWPSTGPFLPLPQPCDLCPLWRDSSSGRPAALWGWGTPVGAASCESLLHRPIIFHSSLSLHLPLPLGLGEKWGQIEVWVAGVPVFSPTLGLSWPVRLPSCPLWVALLDWLGPHRLESTMLASITGVAGRGWGCLGESVQRAPSLGACMCFPDPPCL